MKLQKRCLGILALLGYPAIIIAAPSAFQAKHCGELKLTNETNSTLIRDHKDCSKIWVMPPTTGKVITSNFKKSANLGFCAEMKNIQNFSRQIAQKIGSLALQMQTDMPRLRAAEKKLTQAEKNLAAVANAPAVKDIMDLTQRIADIDSQVQTLTEQLTSCTSNCNVLNSEYKALAGERKLLVSDLRDLRKDFRKEYRDFLKANQEIEIATRHLEFVDGEILSLAEKQTRLKEQLLAMYSNFGKLEGGRVAVNYDLGWDQNLRKLEDQYQNINFSKVSTKDARIHANIISSGGASTYLESLPMVLDYSIAGMAYQPYGEERTPELSAVPSSIQGDMRLSIIGACPYYYSNFLDDDSGELTAAADLNGKDFGMGMSISYNYPAVFKFELEATYNLYKFYEKVVKSGSKGGWFSKKSWKKVSETKIDKETFEIKWLDQGQLYTTQEKEKIRSTIKEELATRALHHMATPAGIRSPQMSAINSFNPEPGALIIAKGLRKSCGWFSFKCQAASWVLKGVTGIFGGGSAEASFKSTHDTTAVEKWNEENVLWRPAATSFVE